MADFRSKSAMLVHVTAIMRITTGINKAEDGCPNQVRRCVAASLSDDGDQLSNFVAGSVRRPCVTEVQ